VTSIDLGWSEFKTYLAEIGPERGHPEPPRECPFCDGDRIWLDGWRVVYCVVLLDGSPHRFDEGLALQRVVCAACRRSWTLRPAFLYPHRSFQPDVVEAAGLDYLSAPAATYQKTAKDHGCSPRSVWRWVGWLAAVVQAGALLAEAEQWSRAGQSASLIPREVPQDHAKARSPGRATTLRAAFQALCALAIWCRAQLTPPADASPLRFWLVERFRAFRELHHLAEAPSSPPSPEHSTGPPRIHR
jgi:hypothetical protein